MSLSAKEKVLAIRRAEFELKKLSQNVYSAYTSPEEFRSSSKLFPDLRVSHEDILYRSPEYQALFKNSVALRLPRNFSAQFEIKPHTGALKSKAIHRDSSSYLTPFQIQLLNEFEPLKGATSKSESLLKLQEKASLGSTKSVDSSKSNSAERVSVRNSLETLKLKKPVAESGSPSRKHAPKTDKRSKANVPEPEGRLFHHQFHFQQALDSSRNSKESSEMSIMTALDALNNYVTNHYPVDGSSQKKANDSGTASPKTVSKYVGAKQSPASSGRPSREQLCIPSMVQNASWMQQRFPRIAKDLLTCKEEFKYKKPMRDLVYPGRKAFKGKFTYSRARSTSPELPKDQPLPHERGLIGIEISDFEPQCAVFYKDRHGTCNPHLHLPRNKNKR